uniref:Glabrous enhancer-binding protein-like DBD domain-containing protein n=1 Tax=Cannabis sativa TaxID=3483 RepID=A0A803QNP4_CANSA
MAVLKEMSEQDNAFDDTKDYDNVVVPDSQSDSDSDQSMANQAKPNSDPSQKPFDSKENEKLMKQLADAQAMPPPPPRVRLPTMGDDHETSCERERVWSEDDDIFVLQNMVEFIDKNCFDYNNNIIREKIIKDSYDVIVAKAESLSLQPRLSQKQLIERVSHLKKQFLDNDNDDSFSNPHLQKVYNLSRLIWGTTRNEDDLKKKKKNLQSMLKDYVSHHGLHMSWIEKSTKQALGDKWLRFKEEECKYLMQKGIFESTMQTVKLDVYRKRFAPNQ